MTKYQLAKLISLAGGIDSRKRIQKIICLLQAAGMNWDVDFRLHHYGPYSTEIASLLDELASMGILVEKEQPNTVGVQYNYRVAEGTDSILNELEKDSTSAFSEQNRDFDAYKNKIDELLNTVELWSLELGSTIAHYHSQVNDWDEAMEKACEFKGVKKDARSSQVAFELAKSMID